MRTSLYRELSDEVLETAAFTEKEKSNYVY